MPEHKAAGWTTPIWEDYKRIVNAAEGHEVKFVEVERFAVSWCGISSVNLNVILYT